MSRYSHLTACRLKQAMKEKHITAQELADKSGVGKSSISQYLNEKFTPTSTNAKKLAAALGVNSDWLMGIEPSDATGFDDDLYFAELSKGHHPKVMKIIAISKTLDDYFLDKLLDYATKVQNMQNDL